MSNTMSVENLPRTLELKQVNGRPCLVFIDQRALPENLVFSTTENWQGVVDAIKTLAVRGAPAIGVAGAAAVALWAAQSALADGRACKKDPDTLYAELAKIAALVASARPTAVNLQWAVDRMQKKARELFYGGASGCIVAEGLFAEVKRMEEEDEAVNRALGARGAALLTRGAHILTHCNAGSLATVFYGTALGVVYSAASQGKIERVYADETRPVGQGARLTVWELSQAGIPSTLICDNMAASLMAQRGVDAVIVGADRIAANGDTANKIGTYGVAVLARYHGIPFYVAAPLSTVDFSLQEGSNIPIEERDVSEVLPERISGVDIWNPAFDVTPARLISKIITESGVFEPHELHCSII